MRADIPFISIMLRSGFYLLFGCRMCVMTIWPVDENENGIDNRRYWNPSNIHFEKISWETYHKNIFGNREFD